MSWKITRDLLHEQDPETFSSQVGKHTKQWVDELLKGPLYHFKLYDDDGELYYEGVNTAETFGPLDWAMNDSGCTYIKYKQKGNGGKWEILNPKGKSNFHSFQSPHIPDWGKRQFVHYGPNHEVMIKDYPPERKVKGRSKMKNKNPVNHCHYDGSGKVRWHSHFGGAVMHEHDKYHSYGLNAGTLKENENKKIPKRRLSYFGKSSTEKIHTATAENPKRRVKKNPVAAMTMTKLLTMAAIAAGATYMWKHRNGQTSTEV